MKTTQSITAAVAASSLVTVLALLGPMAPAPSPGGFGTPIGTLPFECKTPGYYYLTKSLCGEASKGGIDIQAENVVVDLRSHVLQGVPGSTFGIRTSNFATHSRVHGGTVRGWGGRGIALNVRSVVEDVTVMDCGDSGITVNKESRVEGCVLENNALAEISVGANCVVRDCTVFDPQSVLPGVLANRGSTIERVTISGGSPAISALKSARVVDCNVSRYFVKGIDVGDGSIVRGCTVYEPNENAPPFSPIGIATGDHCLVTGTTVRNVANGIVAGAFTRIENCNVGEADGVSVQTGDYSQVTCSVVGETGQNAIVGQRGMVVTDCLVGGGWNGIRLFQDSVARHNVVLDATNGINALGEGNHIDGNDAIENQTGILVQSKKNLVTNNRAIDSSVKDFTIQYPNTFGPTLNTKWALQGSTPQANFRTPFP